MDLVAGDAGGAALGGGIFSEIGRVWMAGVAAAMLHRNQSVRGFLQQPVNDGIAVSNADF
jgi:hypothetical protein